MRETAGIDTGEIETGVIVGRFRERERSSRRLSVPVGIGEANRLELSRSSSVLVGIEEASDLELVRMSVR